MEWEFIKGGRRGTMDGRGMEVLLEPEGAKLHLTDLSVSKFDILSENAK